MGEANLRVAPMGRDLPVAPRVASVRCQHAPAAGGHQRWDIKGALRWPVPPEGQECRESGLSISPGQEQESVRSRPLLVQQNESPVTVDRSLSMAADNGVLCLNAFPGKPHTHKANTE